MSPLPGERLLRALGLARSPIPLDFEPAYTLVYPPTMLWQNFQRPQNLLTQLARRHDVLCLFNDWTVGEERHERGRLIVTRRAFRARYHRRPLVYYYSIPEKLDHVARYRLRPDLVVFELMDIPERQFAAWKERLGSALRNADIVRTTSDQITRYLLEHHGADLAETPVTTSMNGVDLELFDPSRDWPKPPDLAGIDKPILGFYGNLDWWLDWELMGRLAELAEYQVVVIGDTEGRSDRIPDRLRGSSIRWLGRKPVAELPGYLERFDLALFPFVVNEMTDGVDALKLWEYLAFGKPVLATGTAFIRERAELFTLVDDGDLAASVRAALATADDPDRVAARKRAAADRDWGLIAERMHEEILAGLAR